MRLEIPFYTALEASEQDCIHVSCLSLINYFAGKNYSLDEWYSLSKRKPGFLVYLSQMVAVLHDAGLDVKYFSRVSPLPYGEGETYIREHFGETAEHVLAHTDLPSLVNSIHQLVQFKLFQNKVLDAEEMEIHLQQRHGIILIVDGTIILGKEGPFQRQAIVLTGYDKSHFFFHHSGKDFPAPDMIVPKKTLLDAFNAPNTNNEVIIVYGKRANRR